MIKPMTLQTTTPADGVFEACAARFTFDEAWVFDLDRARPQTWQEMDVVEVVTHAGLMTEKEFDKRFGKLPALPKHAFQS